AAAECRVATAVVEVEVAVHQEPHVVEMRAGPGQGGVDAAPARPVARIDLRMAAHAGIDQQQPVRVVDEVPETGFDAWRARAGLLGRPDEVPEVDPAYGEICHGTSLEFWCG